MNKASVNPSGICCCLNTDIVIFSNNNIVAVEDVNFVMSA